MNISKPLEDLQDIITPEHFETALPALGWWLVALGGLLVLIVVLWIIYKYWCYLRPKYIALKQLKQLATQETDLQKVNQLIKRVSLAYYPRQEVAALSGKSWFEFLNAQTKIPLFHEDVSAQWVEQMYHNPIPATSAQVDLAQRWIKQALPTRRRTK